MMKNVTHVVASALFAVCAFDPLFSLVQADGLPGEFVGTQYWRDLDSRYSPLTNPAFLTEEDYLSIRAAEALVLNTFSLTEAGITLPVGMKQSWGFSYFGIGAGNISTTEAAGDSIRETGNSLSDAEHYFMLSYANNLWNKFSLGGNATFSYQSNFSGANSTTSQAMGAAVDVGISYHFPKDPIIGDHLIGLTLQNALSPFDFGAQSYSNNFKLAWLGYYWDKTIESEIEIDSKNVYGALFRDKNPSFIEYTFAARLGASIFHVLNIYAQAGSNYVSFASGVNVAPLIFKGDNNRDLFLSYQYLFRTDVASDAIHTAYLHVQLGEPREKAYERLVRLIPNDLYNKALRLCYAGNYWDAFFVFSKIMYEYPTFFKNDQIAYYRGYCLEHLDMRAQALETYKKAVEDYPSSPAAPQASLGMMRVSYRENAGQDVEARFRDLNKQEISDSLKYLGHYLMGQTYFKEKNYSRAADLLSEIPATHEDYVFAQYSLAICRFNLGDSTAATTALGNCVLANAATAAQKEMVAKSYVLLGYYFFGHNEMSKAVTALRQVPKTSFYYEDALLGMGWSAVRSRQWTDCVSLGQELQKVSKKPTLQCDGALIEGYGDLMYKNYKQAAAVLREASNKAKELKKPPLDSLQARQARYSGDRKDYDDVAASADKASAWQQSQNASRQIDSLHKLQERDKSDIDEFVSFQDEFDRQSFFARNLEVVKNDIDYALAISMHEQSPTVEQNKKIGKQEKQLEDKISKLKEEIGKIKDEKK